MDGDSVNDLAVGRKDGKLTYFHNFGTKFNAQFHPDSSISFFGGINVTVPGFTDGYSSPFVTKEGTSTVLYIGSNEGRVYKYEVNTADLTANFTLLDANALGQDAGF